MIELGFYFIRMVLWIRIGKSMMAAGFDATMSSRQLQKLCWV